MGDKTIPPGVTTAADRNTVSATTVVDASPQDVFEFIRRPANHPIISGDQSVRGATVGPKVLGSGDKFGMKMKIGLPYRIRSKVVEFELNQRIAWAPFNQQRWRWEMEPADGGKTKVTETFDLSTNKLAPALRAIGLPKGHEVNVAKSVANVAAHFSEG